MGGGDAMLADYRKYLALVTAPACAREHNGRAWAHFVLGDLEPARADADRAIALAPDDASGYGTRAHILEALGHTDAAIADFRAALARHPTEHVEKRAREALIRLGSAP
jgi:tetratricopeptide (TPR) repeat protein